MATILIVDDEPQIVQHVRVLLTSFGYHSKFIIKPEFLFKILEKDFIDLILMDINMPGTDGLTLLSQLKEHKDYSKIPVIMLTSDHSDLLVSQCFERGAVDFVTKPISELTLQSRIQSALSAKAYEEELEGKVQERTQQLQERSKQLQERTDQLEESVAEIERASKTFQLFVPEPFIKRIFTKSFSAGELIEEKLSILFLDIRSYTSLSEKMDHKDVFHFLNRFFSLMEPCILKYHGFIDKFVGDSIMALFDGQESANNSVNAAIEMQQSVSIYNETRGDVKRPLVKIGIGINTGTVVVGAVGSENRLSSTVIGDHVNLASRLEQLTKRYDAQILISHNTYHEMVEENYYIREIDTLKVKGKSDPVTIYEVFDANAVNTKEKKSNISQLMSDGIAKYKSMKFKEAFEIFLKCLHQFSQDGVAFEYVKRCKYFINYPPPKENWDGIIEDSESTVNHLIRRRVSRHVFHINANVYFSFSETSGNLVQSLPIAGIVKDLSLTGMNLLSDDPLHLGDTFIVETSFENTPLEPLFKDHPCRMLCRVVRQSPDYHFEGRLVWSIGMEVLIMKPEHELLLNQNLKKLE